MALAEEQSEKSVQKSVVNMQKSVSMFMKLTIFLVKIEALTNTAPIIRRYAMGFSGKLKDMASKAGEKAQDLGGKGKDLMAKAGAKAQDMGERGVLLVEIKQHETHFQKLLARLGAETYLALVEDGEEVTPEVPKIKETLDELRADKEIIDKKKAELQTRWT
jgi:hypothetical protein